MSRTIVKKTDRQGWVWTKDDDKQLIELYKDKRYTFRQIAQATIFLTAVIF
jgi:hypothetical protein